MTVYGETRTLIRLGLLRRSYKHQRPPDLQFPSLCCSLNMKPFGVKVACIEPGFFKTHVTDMVVVENGVKKLWARLPQEVKDDYGESFLESCKLSE